MRDVELDEANAEVARLGEAVKELAVKLTLLVLYVALGSFALKRGRSRGTRALCFVAALTVYAFMYSVARTHQPLGWLY